MTDFYVYDGKIYTSEILTDIYNKNVLEINRAVAETLISRIYIGYGLFGYRKLNEPRGIYSKSGKYLHTKYNIDMKRALNEYNNQIKKYFID